MPRSAAEVELNSVIFRIAALCVAVLLAAGLLGRCSPGDLDGAVESILDGDLDRSSRLAALQVVYDEAVAKASASEDAAVFAAMAALALEDRAAYDRAIAEAGPSHLLGRGEGAVEAPTAPRLARLSLGEPYLESLMLARIAEAAGDQERGNSLRARAARSAKLYGAETALAVIAER